MNNLNSQCALVTGADRGLGLELVKRLIGRGHQVIATTRRKKAGEPLALLSQSHGSAVRVLHLDVADENSIHEFAESVVANELEFDLVINNAGICIDQSFGAWSCRTFSDHFLVNTIGPSLLLQAVSSQLKANAKVVQVSSGMGSLEWNLHPEGGLDAYAASKAALNLLTRRIAEKLRPRAITVCALNPGWVRTDMGGPDAPTSIADAVGEMLETIDGLAMNHSGHFIERDGSTLPW